MRIGCSIRRNGSSDTRDRYFAFTGTALIDSVDGATREPCGRTRRDRRRVGERPRRALGDGFGERGPGPARSKTGVARATCIEGELHDNRRAAGRRHGRDSRRGIDFADHPRDRLFVAIGPGDRRRSGTDRRPRHAATVLFVFIIVAPTLTRPRHGARLERSSSIRRAIVRASESVRKGAFGTEGTT